MPAMAESASGTAQNIGESFTGKKLMHEEGVRPAARIVWSAFMKLSKPHERIS